MDLPRQAIETKNTVARFLGNGVLVVPWTLQICTVILEPLRLILQIVYRLWTALQVCRLEMYWGVQHLSYAESEGESHILPPTVKRNRNSEGPKLNHLALSDSESHIMYSSGRKGKSGSFEPLFFNLQSQHLGECKAFLIQRTHLICDPDPSSTEVSAQSRSSCDSPVTGQEETFGEFPVKDSKEADGTASNNPKMEQLESLLDDKAGKREDDSWDEDESSCQEWDTMENQKLWECFVNAADTYNPLNFSACISSCPQKNQPHSNETHCLKGEARENSSFSSDTEEAFENKNYCYNFGQNCSESETETEEDDWDSSSNCSASDEEENNKLWESFVNPTDPYSPLHFTACTVSTSTTQKSSECLNKHMGPAKVPAKCLTLSNSTKDSSYDSQSINDYESNSEGEGNCEQQNKKLWDSFLQSSDPYNLLNFRACLKSCPTDNKSEGNGVRNETKGTGPVKTASVKPNLPKRHFKHSFQNKSKDNQQFLTWKKPAKATARRTQEKQEKEIVKKVTFSPFVHVHVMHAWDFAFRAARKSPWEEMARDRARFQRRIQEAEETIGCCWNSDHREKKQTQLSAENSVAPTVLT
ncbi:uncharacterized protein LOC121294931 [Polyodon spathula]|uniref:uncharacterized protein LOC121294931 n=1 Tax=Polyodon spathula TaxID=7913 RepID=UPI001B7DF69B|nr:uncharacterized protein LOC121294931 [Polyodon spathula]